MAEFNPSFEDIDRLSRRIAERYRANPPQTIVAICRGGAIPAILVSHYLGIADVRYLTLSAYNDRTLKGAGPRVADEDARMLSALTGRVLVVDDMVDNGMSLGALAEHLPKGAEVAVLYSKAHSPRTHVTYLAEPEALASDCWVNFPWEKRPLAETLARVS
ncbi:phosphoribosyltransferase [Candidatus Raskinella chloraquaticus]|uniref:Phosphoribosyltransferase domain-containing protein n=1 Tax=Candidatus Raskinella chloraquaticus TaxID=1951219 RepID=A0A1W9I4R3_9HYPH|nr:MAG: hypothetical protein A4S15_03545 [Proteobacteria bacterium SG_bin8]